MDILGIRIDDYAIEDLEERLAEMLESGEGSIFAATLNPEILLKAHQNAGYKKILNQADLNICDGFGLKLVSFFKEKRIKNRWAGADLVDFLLGLASQKKYQILAIVSRNSLSSPEEIEKSLEKKYPNIPARSIYFDTGQNFFENGIIKKAEIVLVNFGAPDQEKFIAENREKFPKAKIFVGVGGTFDFLTGKIRRAPQVWRSLGFEWLWRLVQEPKRIHRIANAVIIFPITALMND